MNDKLFWLENDIEVTKWNVKNQKCIKFNEKPDVDKLLNMC